jgi:hypothetical protein
LPDEARESPDGVDFVEEVGIEAGAGSAIANGCAGMRLFMPAGDPASA